MILSAFRFRGAQAPVICLACALSLLSLSQITMADNEIGFLETFALAENREDALAQLIPGTEEYYYFRALHAQSRSEWDTVENLLEAWVSRFGETPRLKAIRHRQALLKYTDDPEGTLTYLKRELDLRFDHRKQEEAAAADLPTALDPATIRWESFRERAFAESETLTGVTDSGLDRLVRADEVLDPKRRRDLLSRLRYPDYPRLAGLVAADLRTRESRGFGEFPIHRNLTREQLEELEGLVPGLAGNEAYVHARLAKLRPGADVDWRKDAVARGAYLRRLWDEVEGLAPSFNSLKAHVLYRVLVHERSRGQYPRDLFLRYLKLPRPTPYMAPRYLQDRELARFPSDLNADYGEVTGLPPVGGDEELVRSFLLHYFVEDGDYEGYAPYLREEFVRKLFAEAKLTSGAGEGERFLSMLTPEEVKTLKGRVDLAFAPSNRTVFGPDDDVSLDVFVKNVSDLMVKVYEVDARNYYLDHKRELSTDLPLDGLVANEEQRYSYDDPPVRRTRRNFTFDSLDGRGVWVVEFIGNGISSRPLIRKGTLEYLSAVTPAGLAVTVVDEGNQLVPGASIDFGGRRYEPGEDGRILLPFSTRGRQPVILSAGSFSALDHIDFPEESYTLDAGIHLEQEQLLPDSEATVTVRPVVRASGTPASTILLEAVTLRVATTDLDGVESVSEVNGFELGDDNEATHSFRVPLRVRQIEVTLEGRIDPIAGGEPVKLSQSANFDVNGTEATPFLGDLHLAVFDGRHVVEALGKSGEPLANRAIQVALHHRDFTRPVRATLKTDESGRIDLGSLEGIDRLEVSGGSFPAKRSWRIRRSANAVPSSIHAVAGESVLIPLPGVTGDFSEDDLAAFEVRGGIFVRNVFSKASFGDGLVILENLEPGDYEVFLRQAGETVTVRVTAAAERVSGYALGESRYLEIRNPTPLQIASVEANEESIAVKLANAGETARVHLVATRFLPQFDLYEQLSVSGATTPLQVRRGGWESAFVSGRDIGEEYRYILDRRSAKRYPGNMADRPGLILNPWELSDTNTEIDDAEAGEDYQRKPAPESAKRAMERDKVSRMRRQSAQATASPGLSFLARPAVVVINAQPGEGGTVTIERAALGDRQLLHVLAVDGDDTAFRSLSLPEVEDATPFRDLRLVQALDRAKRFVQHREVTVLDTGDSLTIADRRASELESFETLSSVHGLLAGLSGEAETLREFAFVTGWPSLDEAEKRERYSEYACHELNFFLSRKDPDFFAAVVVPYLRNKRDKTFFDHYLTGADLSPYTEAWRFGRLNIVERILLARRLGGEEADGIGRHVSDLFALQVPDVAREVSYFQAALRGRRTARGGTIREGLELADQMAVAETASNGLIDALRGRAATRPEALRLTRRGIASAPPGAPSEPAPAAAAVPPMVGGRAGEGGGAVQLGIMDLREEARVRQLYEKLDTTREWAENNYFERPIEEQIASLIEVNAFWRDFAEWDGQGPFASRHFPEAAESFAEAMLALAVLDLPFEAEAPGFTSEGNTLTVEAKSPLIVFHEEIGEEPVAEERPPILVSENFFRNDDRQRMVEGERVDNFVTGEFLTGVLYGSQVVVTNPTSSTHRLDLLLQVPEGAVPANGSDYTRTASIRLDPFTTQKVETFFYFPSPSGEEPFPHYPVHVAKDERPIAWTEPSSFTVVDQLSSHDEASWEYLSHYGTEQEVIDFLTTANVHEIDLTPVAWRVRESVDFFRRIVALLAKRHRFDATLWSYGLHHDDRPVARQYLLHREDFLGQCGPVLECELVSIDPVERHWYQQLEYSPLVNARRHRLGREHKILNDRFREQYLSLLDVLAHRPQLDGRDGLAVANYLFLQDRIEEALRWLDRIDPEEIESTLQLDYLRAYAALYRGEAEAAGKIAARHVEHPVNRWRAKFTKVAAQVSEIIGEGEERSEGEDREQNQESLAASEPTLALTTEGRTVSVRFQNLDEVTVNYYEMDLEFLFSSQPFVEAGSGQFRYVRPNLTERKELPGDGDSLSFEIPERFASRNVLVEVTGGGKRVSSAVYANTMAVTLAENYGRLEVRASEGGAPLARTYVKVYARKGDGTVAFFKDGYTDLRGKFDYVSLNTNELDSVEALSVLVMSEENGSVVREASPPQR